METEKDFSKWMPIKQIIHDAYVRRFYHEREVWWCSVGLNVGFEVDGKGGYYVRPVLIIKDFNHAIFWGIPLTTQLKDGPYNFNIDLGDTIVRQVVLSQLHLMDGKRLQEKFAVLNEDTFIKIKQAIIAFLA
jgi:mRNA interferase MazF